jgi:hypothetical protein
MAGWWSLSSWTHGRKASEVKLKTASPSSHIRSVGEMCTRDLPGCPARSRSRYDATGGDLDLSTAEGAYYGGMETLRARRETAVKSARVPRGPGPAVNVVLRHVRPELAHDSEFWTDSTL